jgi:hypothetical protein
MHARTRPVVLIGLAVLSTVSLSSAASAKNAPGSAKWCRHHPRSALPACQIPGGGGTGSGGSPPVSNITVSPNPVVETGGSDVYAVISVATDPVYAEQTVEIVSALSNRCGQGVTWISDQGSFSGSTATGTVDDDGNATFMVLGGSCAAGDVVVIAEVEAGTDPTYSTNFTIDAPAPGL